MGSGETPPPPPNTEDSAVILFSNTLRCTPLSKWWPAGLRISLCFSAVDLSGGKGTLSWCPLIDLSPLKEFVLQTLLRVVTVASVLLSVREGDFLASVNLTGAYFQIPGRQVSRKLLRFLSDGVVYQFEALCFGLSTAPQAFTRVFCRGLCVASVPQVSASQVPEQLAGPCLLGSRGHKGRSGSALALSLPRDRDKQEVRSCTLKVCNLPRYTHRFQGRCDFPALSQVEKFLSVAKRFSLLGLLPMLGFAMCFWAPGFA